MAIDKGDLAKRIGVGAIYVAITSIATLVSWYTTAIVFAATAALCCYEFLRMARNAGYHPYLVTGTVTAALIPLAFCLLADNEHVIAGGMVVAFVGIIIILMIFFSHEKDTIVDVALTLFGYLYTGLFLSSFILLRDYLPGFEGGLLGFLVIASVWVNDGFAYLGGSAFGKHKMAPHISAKKSWEGLFFGLLGSVLTWLLIPLLVPSCGFGHIWAVIGGVLVGVAGVIGDLTESHIKRGFNTKDSGNLMPGHGGLLDRSDSLIFASVVAYAVIAGAPYIFDFLGFAL